MLRIASALAVLIAALTLPRIGSETQPARTTARVVDASTSAPIAGAMVTDATGMIRTNADGRFELDPLNGPAIHARAPGYRRAEVSLSALHANPEIRLTPFRPKAVYLSVYGIGSTALRNAVLTLIDTTALNAVVIDMKGDRGIVPYRSAVGLAATVGAQRVMTIDDLPALVADLKRRGVYTIARVVVFKDTLLAEAIPDLAIRRHDGSVFRDREHLAWADPFSREVWHYNIAIAVEAAKAGFDEIQFDYARLPDTSGLAYGVPWTERNREAAIEGFLQEARQALTPFNVFLAIDVFGYVCWNPNDTEIGQKLEHLPDIVDYVSPMLYPSSFQFGIPGYRNPVEQPFQIVRLSLEEARRRTSLPPVRFRPWLQAFRDYAFGGRPFTAADVRAQISAAEQFGADGWMLWNPHNEYAADGIPAAEP